MAKKEAPEVPDVPEEGIEETEADVAGEAPAEEEAAEEEAVAEDVAELAPPPKKPNGGLSRLLSPRPKPVELVETTPPDMSASPGPALAAQVEQSNEEFVNMTPDEREWLMGTEVKDAKGEDFIGAPSEESITEMTMPSQSDEEFLFGTGLEEKPKPKVKYTVRPKGEKTRKDRSVDDFLFNPHVDEVL